MSSQFYSTKPSAQPSALTTIDRFWAFIDTR